ncbi:MAG: VOC family protein [Acidimicrobiaceae bacterium]|nr:VOC family protein [Acidimicrobiaceae bacterium]
MVDVQLFAWYSSRAREAFWFYSNIFGVSDGDSPHRDDSSAEEFVSGRIRVGEIDLVVFNGEPHGDFSFSSALSIFLTCEDQSEVDFYWESLSRGGEPGRCGWLRDPYGLSWQIVPRAFHDLMADPDLGVRERVRAAMRGMDKFEVAELYRAAEGLSHPETSLE